MSSLNQSLIGTRWVAVLLSWLVTFQAIPLHAQNPGQSPKLNIVIVEGDGAINNIRQRVAREPIVQVEDENHKPVAGAVVTFLLPGDGPSGVFPNGSRTITVMTDSNGRAVARGIKPNHIAGKMEIHVTASHQGAMATANITQTNVAGAAAGAGAGISVKLLVILAVAAGAAAAGAIAATHGGGGQNPAATGAVITAGTPTVGAPR